MNCDDALEWLEAEELRLPIDDPAAVEEARRHLAECVACQREWPMRKAWAHPLACSMGNVEISGDLEARLVRQLVGTPAVAPVAQSRPGRRPARRRWWIAASVAVALLMVISVTPWRPSQKMALSELYATVPGTMEELPPFAGSFAPRLPAGWSQVFQFDPSLARGYPSSGPHAARVAMIPFSFASRERDVRVRGRLLIARRSDVHLPEPTFTGREWPSQFSSAEVLYLKSGEGLVVWLEDDLVFICLMPTGPADLQRFQQALTGRQTLT